MTIPLTFILAVAAPFLLAAVWAMAELAAATRRPPVESDDLSRLDRMDGLTTKGDHRA